MPRYFFNRDGDGFPEEDQDGTVLGGPEQARAAAVRLLGELLEGAESRFWTKAQWRLHVTDEEGATVCVLTLVGEREGQRRASS